MSSSNWLIKRLSSVRTQKQKEGDIGEEQALQYLLNLGLKVVDRSYLCKGGEIDLIMKDQDSLVFVEVRKRKSNQFGGALASITLAKQRKMTRAAQVYLSTLKTLPKCRFDVIAIEDEEITWLKNVILEN